MLPSESLVAQVIISKLEQPHKFDFVIQCKCGFQSHGYANEDASLGEADILAKQAAATHLINRHGARPVETADRIRELEKPTSGGMSYGQLELLGQTKGFKKTILEKPAELKVIINESKEKLPSPALQAQKPPTTPSPVSTPAPAAKPPQPAAQIAALKAEADAKTAREAQANKPKDVAPGNAGQVQTGGVKK